MQTVKHAGRIRMIVNPISGMGRAGAIARALERGLTRRGHHVEILETQAPGDACRFASQATGVDRLVCVGGDGTLSEVGNGLVWKDPPPVAPIPSGSGNAFAKELRLPTSPRTWVEMIERGPIVRWDVGLNRTIGRRFLLFAGAGVHAEVIRRFHTARRGPVFFGHSQYVPFILQAAFRPELPRVTVEVDGRILGRDIPWVEVHNISHYGGPLRPAAHASPSDGAFDILIFQSRRRRDLFRLMLCAFTNFWLRGSRRIREMDFRRGRRVRLFSDDEVPVHMDGDHAGSLPAEIEILPGAIALVGPPVPASNGAAHPIPGGLPRVSRDGSRQPASV